MSKESVALAVEEAFSSRTYGMAFLTERPFLWNLPLMYFEDGLSLRKRFFECAQAALLLYERLANENLAATICRGKDALGLFAPDGHYFVECEGVQLDATGLYEVINPGHTKTASVSYEGVRESLVRQHWVPFPHSTMIPLGADRRLKTASFISVLYPEYLRANQFGFKTRPLLDDFVFKYTVRHPGIEESVLLSARDAKELVFRNRPGKLVHNGLQNDLGVLTKFVARFREAFP